MFGVIRRRVANGGLSSSSSSILRQSLQTIRPAPSSTSRVSDEILTHARGFEHVRKFSCLVSPRGRAISSRPVREVVSNMELASSKKTWSRPFSSDTGDLVDAVVPFMGESITDGTLAKFLKNPGDRVEVDEAIAQIETDKVTIDVASPEAGVIKEYIAKEGDTVEPGAKIAVISKSGEGVAHVAPSENISKKAAPKQSASQTKDEEKQKPQVEARPVPEKPKTPATPPPKRSATEPQLPPKERERRVPMTRLRKRVATRLKDSQNTFAMLTTFNEVDMTNLMKLRSDYKDAFVEKHGVKLGLMSGFIKAAVSGLQNQPIINAVIDGDDIIYRDYVDISIAVGTPKGLVVPVIRNAGKMNFAEIEKEINTPSDSETMRCISCKEYYSRCDAGTCKECYEEASDTEEELKREIEDLKAKVAFLRFWSPLDLHITHRSPAGPCFTDVVLIASSDDGLIGTPSVPVPAHKAVLVSRSPVFKAMLENEMEESRSGTIKISDVSYDALRSFVNYLYTAEACLDEQMACDLLVLAEKYEVKHLKAYCEKFLVSKLNWDNSVMSYAFAHQHNAKHMLETALSLITDNMDKLTKRKEYIELVEEDPRLVVEIYEAYLSKQVNTAAHKDSSSMKP